MVTWPRPAALSLGVRWPWMALLVLVAAAGVTAYVALRDRRRSPRRDPGARYASHTARLRSLPRFQWLARRWRAVVTLQVVGLALVLVGAGWLAARPTGSQTEEHSPRNRDIMLCLDASGSMSSSNVQVVRQVRAIVDRLRGQRIGMTLFSTAAVTVFPLTDDYGYVRDELGRAQWAFGTDNYDYVAGTTLVEQRRASQMGDGTVSCVQRLTAARPAGERRSQAVVVASDNQPQGRGIYSLTQAAAFARRRHVVVYGIGANSMNTGETAGFRRFAAATGGRFYRLGEVGTTTGVVAAIERLEARRSRQVPRAVVTDRPAPALLPLGLGLALLVGGGMTARRLGFAARTGRPGD